MKLLLISTLLLSVFRCYNVNAENTIGVAENSIFQGLVESMINETMQSVANSLSSVIFSIFQFVDDEDQCPLSCIGNATVPQELSDLLESLYDEWLLFRNQTSTAEINMMPFFNVPRLQMACGVFHQLTACINDCQERPWKKRLSEWLRPVKYACDESNFIQNADCYRGVYREDRDHCDEKCSGAKRKLLTSFRTQHNPQEAAPSLSDYARMTVDEVKFACEYILCKTKCRSRELVSNCGQEAESALKMTYRYVVSSIKSINKFTFDSLEADSSQKLQYADLCDSI